jgi:hypothetical protein
MADGLVNMSSQFKGLPMEDLIGAPLTAACNSQLKLANATANFIKVIGFLPPTKDQIESDPNAVGGVRTAIFKFDRPAQLPAAGDTGDGTIPNATETVEIEVPLLAIVKVPNLNIDKVDVTFDMEVKSSTSDSSSSDKELAVDAEAKVGWGVFSASVKVHGSISAHQEHTRTSDNSAKYHVEVHASDTGIPEGLARVLDILQTAAAPKSITSATHGEQPH